MADRKGFIGFVEIHDTIQYHSGHGIAGWGKTHSGKREVFF